MKRARVCVLLCCLMMFIFSLVVYADENRYYIGEVVNTGKDNGYSGSDEINKDDPHFGWSLGDFYIDGYTRVMDEHTSHPTFLKNVGDTVTLWFSLEQDISCLNGDDDLYICSDKNGYYEEYDIPKSNIGRGTLIIKHTDYQNNSGDPIIYTNYLEAEVSEDANTEVYLCEEGDYEVTLLYEIKNDGFLFLNSYENYRISFTFSVRNGNAMVFPFDVETGEELTNTSYTENGFYLDLAKSRYLNVDIKKEVLKEGAEGLVEDTRFNRPAKDGEEYTEEGIYTITVTNKYTNQTTEKKIYVGTNSTLRAHVVTGLSINEIDAKLEEGAVINNDGTLDTSQMGVKEEKESFLKSKIFVAVICICVVLVSAVVIAVVIIKRKKKLSNVTNEDGEEIEGGV